MFSVQVTQWNNTRQTIDTVLSGLPQVLKFAIEFRDEQGKSLDAGGNVAGQNYSLKEAVLYGERALRAFRSLRLDKNKPLPGPVWTTALNSITEIRDATNALLGMVATVAAEGRPVNVPNGSIIAIRETGETLINFSSPASGLVAAADQLAGATATLFSSVRASDLARNTQETALITDDSKASAVAAVQAEEASRHAIEAAARATHFLAEIDANRATAEATITSTKEKLTQQVNDGDTLVEQIKSSAGTVQENAAVVAARLNDVIALKSQMDATNAALTSYNSTLETTQSRVSEVEKAAQDVVTEFESQRNEIARMLQDAEHMLSSSTVAGLATAFDKERQTLDRALLGAQCWFLVGIVLLIVTTLPLLSYVTNAPLDLRTLSLVSLISGKANYELTVAGVLSRGIIILGPFWLTLFSARRYRSLFELRQQYSHKYNMAFSMEGFKKQAPEFAENIAAWVFSIVAANPVQQRPGGDMDEAPSTSFKDFGELAVRRLGAVFGLKPES